MPFYFAYGSNMNSEQMVTRCPSALPVGAARLPDHALEFSIPSLRDSEYCVANIYHKVGSEVRGRIWNLSDYDLVSLDIMELCYTPEALARLSGFTGHKPEELLANLAPDMAYCREVKRAILQATGDVLECHAYMGSRKNPHGRPSQRYWDIISRGAAECGFQLK